MFYTGHVSFISPGTSILLLRPQGFRWRKWAPYLRLAGHGRHATVSRGRGWLGVVIEWKTDLNWKKVTADRCASTGGVLVMLKHWLQPLAWLPLHQLLDAINPSSILHRIDTQHSCEYSWTFWTYAHHRNVWLAADSAYPGQQPPQHSTNRVIDNIRSQNCFSAIENPLHNLQQELLSLKRLFFSKLTQYVKQVKLF